MQPAGSLNPHVSMIPFLHDNGFGCFVHVHSGSEELQTLTAFRRLSSEAADFVADSIGRLASDLSQAVGTFTFWCDRE